MHFYSRQLIGGCEANSVVKRYFFVASSTKKFIFLSLRYEMCSDFVKSDKAKINNIPVHVIVSLWLLFQASRFIAPFSPLCYLAWAYIEWDWKRVLMLSYRMSFGWNHSTKNTAEFVWRHARVLFIVSWKASQFFGTWRGKELELQWRVLAPNAAQHANHLLQLSITQSVWKKKRCVQRENGYRTIVSASESRSQTNRRSSLRKQWNFNEKLFLSHSQTVQQVIHVMGFRELLECLNSNFTTAHVISGRSVMMSIFCGCQEPSPSFFKHISRNIFHRTHIISESFPTTRYRSVIGN